MTDGGNGADELGLTIRLLHKQVVVGVTGEVDLATAPDLGCLLGALVHRGHTEVVLDLANLDFLNSSGLQMIEDTATRLRASGGVLRIRSPSDRTRWLLDIGEVSGLVEFEPSDPDLVPLGSEQQAGDNATIVTAAAADQTAVAGWATSMPAGHDVVEAALELVTALAQATVGGADGASVSLARHGRMGTVAATDDTIAQMDRDQYATGQGPCLAAAGEGHWFHVESTAEEARWPDFVPRARAGGIGSILSTPLMATAGRSVGALNIYSRTEPGVRAAGAGAGGAVRHPGSTHPYQRRSRRRAGHPAPGCSTRARADRPGPRRGHGPPRGIGRGGLRHPPPLLASSPHLASAASDRDHGVHPTAGSSDRRRTVSRPVEMLELGRRAVGLSQGELWFRYFELGGMSTALQVDAYLYGALIPTPHDGDLIAAALNERFLELGGDHPIPYSDDQRPAIGG